MSEFIILFFFFGFFYDKILSFFFSKNGNFFISLIDKGCHLNKKHPYLVGFFYGICFLSFFLRFEMPESSFFNFLNFFLLFIRNLLIIPFMGVLGLLNWVSKTFSNLIQEKVITEGELSTILTQNQQFSAFDKKLFSYLPFLSSQKKNYSLESRRTMFHFSRIMTQIPSKETLRQTTTSVAGTTLTGSVALTCFFAGARTDKNADSNLKQTTSSTSLILQNPATSNKEKDMALFLQREAKDAWNDWAANGGSTQVFRGIKYLISEPGVMSKLERSDNLRSQASTLYTIGQYKTLSPEQKEEMLSKLSKRAEMGGAFYPKTSLEKTHLWDFLFYF